MSTKKIYNEYCFKLSTPDIFNEIFIAILSNIGFEGFVETEEGFIAYIKSESDININSVLKNYTDKYIYSIKKIYPENWNRIWEKQISSLVIDNKVYIKPSFHAKRNYPYEIQIDPKMSFGTGHHETTSLMIKQMLKIDFNNKIVLDMGAGTGVLSVLAEQMGAKEIYAVDIDQWAYENMIENFNNNNTTKCKALLGGANLLKKLPAFDIILANINLNILQQDMKSYINKLKNESLLLLSGFLEQDIDTLKKQIENFGMIFENKLSENKWQSLLFSKKF